MKRILIVCAALSFISLLLKTPAIAQADFLTLQNRVIEIYEEYQDSVVRVNVFYERENENGEMQQAGRAATGFFVSRLGHILTTRSVVYQATRIWVEHNRIAYPAIILGEDRRSNVALVKAEILPEDFTFVTLDNNFEMPPIASTVVGISLPLEFSPTPSMGMITGYESSVYTQEFPTTHLRTNIFFGLGESGALIMDLNGNFVGMNVVTLLDIPSSYILPTRALFKIRDDLIFGGRVIYSWFGMEAVNVAESIQGSRVVVEEVIPGGPAEDVGIEMGDRILSIADTDIRQLNDVRNASFFARVGRFVRVKILRGGEERVFSLRVTEIPAQELQIRATEEEDSPE